MSGQPTSGEELYREVKTTLLLEAELLDDGRLREWLDLLTDNVAYRMPVRVTRQRAAGSEFVENMTHLEEDRHTLELRIRRLEVGPAWAEDPPSRTRHFVSNVRVTPGERDDEVQVKSNPLLYRSRGDSPQHDLLSAERRDVLRRVDGRWKLARRLVLLDQSTVATHNLSMFL